MRMDGEPYPFVCVIWDVSEGGARIAIANPQAITDEITLLLLRDATHGTRCRVAWRTDEQIGLQFLENAQAILRGTKQGNAPLTLDEEPRVQEAELSSMTTVARSIRALPELREMRRT
jgi:hypothetical protein